MSNFASLVGDRYDPDKVESVVAKLAQNLVHPGEAVVDRHDLVVPPLSQQPILTTPDPRPALTSPPSSL
jgi:hypothetical protein